MKKILVVDDEPVNIELVKGFLPKEYEVHTATDGNEALAKAEEISPDLVLLDVIMPEINGYEVCRQLKSNAKTFFIPIVMLTSLIEKENWIKAIKAGADDFLNKPLDKFELNARVKSLLLIKQYLEDLEKINNRYIELYDFAPVGYFTFTNDGMIREANLTGAVILGVTRQEMINSGFRSFVAPGDLEQWDRHLSNTLKNWEEQSCELTLKREDGSTLFVRLSSIDIVLPRKKTDGEFKVFKAQDVYCPSGKFVPSEMLTRLSGSYDQAIKAGYPGTRVSGEMSWALKGIPGSERLMEYEALINTISDKHPVTPICQYDTRRFDGATLLNVLRVHPMMIVQGKIVQNPYFISPHEFLKDFVPGQ